MCSKCAGHQLDKCDSRGDRLSTISVSDTLKLSLVQAVALLENLVLTDALKLNAYTGFVDTVCYTGQIVNKEIFVLSNASEPQSLNHCLKS